MAKVYVMVTLETFYMDHCIDQGAYRVLLVLQRKAPPYQILSALSSLSFSRSSKPKVPGPQFTAIAGEACRK